MPIAPDTAALIVSAFLCRRTLNSLFGVRSLHHRRTRSRTKGIASPPATPAQVPKTALPGFTMPTAAMAERPARIPAARRGTI